VLCVKGTLVDCRLICQRVLSQHVHKQESNVIQLDGINIFFCIDIFLFSCVHVVFVDIDNGFLIDICAVESVRY
jgi:hypothetical protein